MSSAPQSQVTVATILDSEEWNMSVVAVLLVKMLLIQMYITSIFKNMDYELF